MSNETTLTVTGNLVADPDLRYPPTGQPVASFRVAATPRYYDQATKTWKDGDTLFLACQAWRQLAENTAESLTKGMRVIVTGRLRQRTYDASDGTKRTVYELQADDLGPSLRTTTAQLTKPARAGSQAADGGA
jgi:single-strand DNA-binding protein